MRPIAYKFDTTCRNIANLPKPGGFRILYKCPQCNEPLCDFLCEREKYCHNCGQHINWGVITYINSTQSEKVKQNTKYADSLLSMINTINYSKVFDEPMFLKEDETKAPD